MTDDMQARLSAELRTAFVPFDATRAEEMARRAVDQPLLGAQRRWLAPLAAAAAVVVVGGGAAMLAGGTSDHAGSPAGGGNGAPCTQVTASRTTHHGGYACSTPTSTSTSTSTSPLPILGCGSGLDVAASAGGTATPVPPCSPDRVCRSGTGTPGAGVSATPTDRDYRNLDRYGCTIVLVKPSGSPSCHLYYVRKRGTSWAIECANDPHSASPDPASSASATTPPSAAATR